MACCGEDLRERLEGVANMALLVGWEIATMMSRDIFYTIIPTRPPSAILWLDSNEIYFVGLWLSASVLF